MQSKASQKLKTATEAAAAASEAWLPIWLGLQTDTAAAAAAERATLSINQVRAKSAAISICFTAQSCARH